MKLTILGHWGAYPEAGEATAGYLLEDEGEKVLLDCGSGVLAQLQKHMKPTELSHAIITHAHHDHVADLGCLQYACLIDTDLKLRAEPLPIYFAHDPQGEDGVTAIYKSMMGSVIIPFTDKDNFQLGNMRFSFMKTFHGAYCVAVKIQFKDKTIVYTADTFFDESLIDFCRDADLLLAETSFYAEFENARDYGHMNSAEVGQLAAKANVNKLILIHLPHFGEISQLAEEVQVIYKGDVQLARCGLVVNL
ncbi:MBL fold metallo-hydrolase [Paenibacillus sp. GP183]|jgi:ribonuclease BN (tRNA processing enzyme)|uniref:MBL fold metallo-hydrolase n=1 Tax=Paenibacillus sp. GP183 TaxID=1882751 RepID=UPI00089A50E1|nr:MBL fold metallo-hydrolase [Paenibacillus sp. GP183]SEC26626.1 Ribonuclease BN, tRNA processing enzyme [Paenibacillus sp. GP183]